MKCPNCGDHLVKKSRNPIEGWVVRGRYMLIKSGALTVACKQCGRETVITKPTVLRVDR